MQKMNCTRHSVGMAKYYLKKAVLWCRHNPRKVELLLPAAFMVALVTMEVLM